jgi:hypothetical protein
METPGAGFHVSGLCAQPLFVHLCMSHRSNQDSRKLEASRAVLSVLPELRLVNVVGSFDVDSFEAAASGPTFL